jgi:hypothetical protein
MEMERRDQLLTLVVSGAPEAAAAARELIARPEWTSGAVPPTLLAALVELHPVTDHPVLDVARAWEPGPRAAALWQAFVGARDAALRERLAALLGALAGRSIWRELATAALDPGEESAVRRHLLESLDRLAFGRWLGWPELEELVRSLAQDADAGVRDGVVGILMSLPRRPVGDALLRALIDDADDWVAASALHAVDQLGVDVDEQQLIAAASRASPLVHNRAREILDRRRSFPPC